MWKGGEWQVLCVVMEDEAGWDQRVKPTQRKQGRALDPISRLPRECSLSRCDCFSFSSTSLTISIRTGQEHERAKQQTCVTRLIVEVGRSSGQEEAATHSNRR